MVFEIFVVVEVFFFLGYYFKNDSIQDQVVLVLVMLEMYDQLSMLELLKRKVVFFNVDNYVLVFYIGLKDLDYVWQEIFWFVEEVFGFKVVL